MAPSGETVKDLLKADELPVQTMSIPNYNDVKHLLFALTENIVDMMGKAAREILPRFVTLCIDDPLMLWNLLISYLKDEVKTHSKLTGAMKSLKKFRNKLTHGKFIGLRDYLTLPSYLNVIYFHRHLTTHNSSFSVDLKKAVENYINISRQLQLEIERKGYRKQLNTVLLALHQIAKGPAPETTELTLVPLNDEGTSSSAPPAPLPTPLKVKEDTKKIEEDRRRVEEDRRRVEETERLKVELEQTRALVEMSKQMNEENAKFLELNSRSGVVIQHVTTPVQGPPPQPLFAVQYHQGVPYVSYPGTPSHYVDPRYAPFQGYPAQGYPQGPFYTPFPPQPLPQPLPLTPAPAPVPAQSPPPKPLPVFSPYLGKHQGVMLIRTFRDLFGNCSGVPATIRHGLNHHPSVVRHFPLINSNLKDLDPHQISDLDLGRCLIIRIEDGESINKLARFTRWNGSNCLVEILGTKSKVNLSLDKRHVSIHSTSIDTSDYTEIVEMIPAADPSLIKKSK